MKFNCSLYNSEGLPDYVWDRYQTSLKMSTYLVVLMVSEFVSSPAPPDLSNVEFNMWSRVIVQDQTKYNNYYSRYSMMIYLLFLNKIRFRKRAKSFRILRGLLRDRFPSTEDGHGLNSRFRFRCHGELGSHDFSVKFKNEIFYTVLNHLLLQIERSSYYLTRRNHRRQPNS